MANSSFYSTGGGSTPPQRSYEPVIDKDRFYRTNKIFEGAYKKTIKLEDGKENKTDCVSTVWVKFADPIDQAIIEHLSISGTKGRYLLACGHEWEGKLDRIKSIGELLPCMGCGADQSYLGFEHEWQHIIFKTDPKMAKVFIGPWAAELYKIAPYVDQKALETFLFHVLNAFDDIRCNSLWELLYAGSADRIWQRWTRLSARRSPAENSTNFIGFLFAVALGTPTLPDGPFEEMRPDIEWGMRHVRYKGYARSLTIAKVALDRCLRRLLELSQPQQGDQQYAQDDIPSDQGISSDQGAPQPHQGDGGGLGPESSGGDNEGDDFPDDAGQDGASLSGDPSHPAPIVNPAQPPHSGNSGLIVTLGDSPPVIFPPPPGALHTVASAALNSIIQDATVFDEKEKHELPEGLVDPSSLPDTAKAAIARALQTDPYDPQLDQDIPAGYIDQDMQAAIDSFRDGVTRLSQDSQLTSDAKANVLLIDVRPDGIDSTSRISLNAQEREAVERMRGIFFRTLGKLKTQRDTSGLSVDIDAAIQYLIKPNNPEIFENSHNNQGFAYLTLCDMSGSMADVRFHQVAHATEMLKKALRFPFVDGTLWGFRGGDPIQGRGEVHGEVWIYRYHKHCEGYLGKGKVKGRPFTFPVRCGGLTPMHAAIRVAVKHLLSNVPNGMAKRLFLLTDGAPCGHRTSGKGLPPWVLQQYVEKEIRWARQKGIQVYTLVIDGGLEDQECRQMFGAPRYWRNTSSRDSENSVDRVLQHLVIQNFERYLKTRG